jgi:hypothetical protein
VAWAVALGGPGVGGTGPFVSLPLGFSRPLTGLLGAAVWGLDAGIGHKKGAAVATPQGMVHGFLLPEAPPPKEAPAEEEADEPHPKQKGKNKQGIPMRREGSRTRWAMFSGLRLVHFCSGESGALLGWR